MRFTIARKLAAGLTALACLGIMTMLVVYSGLLSVERAMHHLSESREPASTAGHEMEINVNEIGLSVLKYLEGGDPSSREHVATDVAEFEHFHARYVELAETETEKSLAATVGERFREFKTLGQVLLSRRDEQEDSFPTASQSFAALDGVIDEKLQHWEDRVTPEQWPKLFLALDLEDESKEVAVWLANYQRTHNPGHRTMVLANAHEFRGALRLFRALELPADERVWVERVEALFDATMALVARILDAEDAIRADAVRFDQIRVQLDHLLDEQVQAEAYQALTAPRRAADAATVQVVRALQVLIPVFVLVALAIGIALVRVITDPLRRLARGTAAISKGDLSYRVEGLAHDEFGDLAGHFNHMVERLEATTVSKARLEASEARLRKTVEELRTEISERQRAEAEGARLQQRLRRSETMSAMGALVAGVAHEVRNPLFGISSTLDALEARLGVRDDVAPHLDVLRGEVQRLSHLMQSLLHYGRPGGSIRVTDAVHDTMAEAIEACSGTAAEAEVTLACRLEDGGAAIAMEPSAMVQVFRNLIENAIQHSPPGATVTIETSVVSDEEREWLECTVRDAGPGFRPDDLAHVFDPFFTRRRGGTGLGLSIVQRVVDEHDGRVRAANLVDGGAVVTVRLPLAAPAADAAARAM